MSVDNSNDLMSLDELTRIDQEAGRYDETLNPMIKEVRRELECRVSARWNLTADSDNQWDSLSDEKKAELIAQEAAGAE